MSKHANVKPVAPATEAEILEFFETRWTLAQPPQKADLPPYRGHTPPPDRGPPPFVPAVLKAVTVEEIEQYLALVMSLRSSLKQVLRDAKRLDIVDFNVRCRKPTQGLYRARDFAREVLGNLAQAASEGRGR